MSEYRKIIMLLFVLTLIPVQALGGSRHKDRGGPSTTNTYSVYDKDWNRSGYVREDKDRTVIYDKDYNVKGYIKNGTIYDKDWGRKGYIK